MIYHHSGNIVHESLVAIDFFLRIKSLVDDEVVVAFECMTIDDGIVVVVAFEELLELFCSLYEMMDRESNILDETSSAYRAHATYRRENARADSPILSDSGRIGSESMRAKSRELSNSLVDN